MTIVGLIVVLVLVGLAFWVIRQLSGAFGIPQPIVTVIYVILVVLVVLWLLSAFGLIPAVPIKFAQ
jgi:hypothetical protein